MHVLLERGFWRADKMQNMREEEGQRETIKERNYLQSQSQCPVGQLGYTYKEFIVAGDACHF